MRTELLHLEQKLRQGARSQLGCALPTLSHPVTTPTWPGSSPCPSNRPPQTAILLPALPGGLVLHLLSGLYLVTLTTPSRPTHCPVAGWSRVDLAQGRAGRINQILWKMSTKPY